MQSGAGTTRVPATSSAGIAHHRDRGIVVRMPLAGVRRKPTMHEASGGRRRGAWRLVAAAATGALAASGAAAQVVALSGMMGERALIVVDGGAPQVMAAGDVRDGVKLVSVGADSVVVEVGGRRQHLRVGDVPVSVGHASSASNGTRIVLSAGSGGHYTTTGQINGKSVQFLVDTGASAVILGATDAQRIGLDYGSGKRALVGTANGVVPSFQVKLDSIRIGDVEVYGVDATVVPSAMPFVLLGNTFLSRFQMKQENALLTLEKRY